MSKQNISTTVSGDIIVTHEIILNNSKAIAFLLEEGEIMDYLQQSNTKESVRFFDDYEQALIWLNEYPI
ncbi:hypothetical protein [Bacillus thuringiensis]|uniref:hypothetical protein n=1 Tax=Bacillus thuringiensis TaxID=1428 RepID=UPI0011AAF0D3|nr:hypothetical protein [Bacillus thuringiensis]